MAGMALLAGNIFSPAAGGETPASKEFLVTETYRWVGDSILQGPFRGYAVSDTEIISDYGAQPGYFMPVDKTWKLKNDISAYPQLETPDRLHRALYNMALDEMVNAVEPDTTLRTGREWPGVWTRDVSYSILLSMAWMQPEASRISLMKKVDPLGRIIQDTGSGGAWPISTDREIWTIAAYEVYLATGSREWLEYVYPIARKSLETDWRTVIDPETGLVKGETSFIDWREQSHPKWMQTADVAMTQTLSTSVVHARAWEVLARMASLLGKKKEAAEAEANAKAISDAINSHLWDESLGAYDMYLYGRDFPIANPRYDTLGESLAILWNIASEERADTIVASNPVTPFGSPVFYPQIADMPPYHNNALWPWVAAWWTLANARQQNEEGVMEGFGSIFRPATLFATNKENLRLDNGDIATELNSSNMLWCLAGNIALTHRILFGIEHTEKGLRISPFVPEALGATRTLKNFKYRNATIDLTVSGFGSKVASMTINGKPSKDHVIPANAKGHLNVVVEMDNEPIKPKPINRTANAAAPLTPITRLTHSPELAGPGVPVENLLSWQPIEYIAEYIVLRDGKPVERTRKTSYPATIPGEYQVIGVSSEGIPGFASEPLSNRPVITVEMPSEKTTMSSSEISYIPKEKLEGYHGGFIETDRSSVPVTLNVVVPEAGPYSIRAIYANGNGPVNTENKAAIRTLDVNGTKAGQLIMPQRGVANWNDWGLSTPVNAELKKGENELTILFTPDDENMNITTNHALIDRLVITPLTSAAAVGNEPFWLGADISNTTADEARGRFTKNSAGRQVETTKLMQDLGMNAIRLRVWVNPTKGFCNAEDVLVMAKRARDLGMPVMIDFHYSDWWADPGKQNIPEDWKNLDYEGMKKAVADHTRETLIPIRDAGVDVKWVQVGNETTNGMLWEMGRAQTNPEQYAGLFKAGAAAVREVMPDAKVIVHLDNGFDRELYDWNLGILRDNGAEWDMVGMSLYPQYAVEWSGMPDEQTSIQKTVENIKHVKEKFGTDVMIVEVGAPALKAKEGKETIAAIIKGAAENTAGICKGVWYWAPECNSGDLDGYMLGAFLDDRPTEIMDAFTEAAERYNGFSAPDNSAESR